MATSLLLLAIPAYGASVPSAPTDMTIQGGLLCDSPTELTAMLGLIAHYGQSIALPGCGMLMAPARVQATRIGEFHQGDINVYLYRFEGQHHEVQFGVKNIGDPAQTSLAI
ncbi:MAG: hypothetical protein KGL39_48850 [Patescibacteria group bacterium]|nr:hypothetical protein [Patescibacteria group bacterium]